MFGDSLCKYVTCLLPAVPLLLAEGAQSENRGTDSTFSVSAAPEGNTINLSWSTRSETASDYFIVQRSADGYLFDDVMQELAAGNSSVENNYSVTDYRPHSGASFYRVVEVDMDGRITRICSTVAKLQMELSITLHAATGNGAFNVNISHREKEQVLIVVQDMRGTEYYSKVVLLRSVDELLAIEPEGKLPPGLYTVIASSSNAVSSKKIIITR